MTIEELQARALEIADKYTEKNKLDRHSEWNASAYMAGFVGDVGDLSKLVMAKSNYRHIEELDHKLAHEISDCLWSVMVLAHHLNVDLETEFMKAMSELEKRIAV